MSRRDQAERNSAMDPQDPHAKQRAEIERQRSGVRAEWGGQDLFDKLVFIEGAVYHFRGKVESISYNVVWLKDAWKVFNNSKENITEEIYIGRWSVPVPTILGLGLAEEVAWMDGMIKESDRVRR